MTKLTLKIYKPKNKQDVILSVFLLTDNRYKGWVKKENMLCKFAFITLELYKFFKLFKYFKLLIALAFK